MPTQTKVQTQTVIQERPETKKYQKPAIKRIVFEKKGWTTGNVPTLRTWYRIFFWRINFKK